MSAPATPRSHRTPKKQNHGSSSALRRTIINFDPNSSYLEEEDATYIDETTMVSSSSDEEEDDDETENQDILEMINEETSMVQEGETKQPSPTPAEKALFDPETSVVEPEPESDKLGSKIDEKTAKKDGNDNFSSKFHEFVVKHELFRKSLHSFIGVFTLWLYTLGVHQTQIILPLATLFAIIFTNDFIRLRNPELNERICKAWWFLIRDSEVNNYNGTLYFLVGLIIVFSLAPKDVSLMSVLLLSWSDTSASTFGRAYGKYTPQIVPGKSLAGCLASFVTGIFACFVLYGYFIPTYYYVNSVDDIMWTPGSSKLSLPMYALLSGFISSFSECVDLGGLDDNFTIPVLSGGFIYLLLWATQK